LSESSCSEQLKTELWLDEVFNGWLLAAFFSRSERLLLLLKPLTAEAGHPGLYNEKLKYVHIHESGGSD